MQSGAAAIPPAAEANGSLPRGPDRRFVVEFEYLGPTGLTAIGGATGRRYRFERTGARVVVHPRDRPSLRQVPHLREVRLAPDDGR